MRITSLLLLLTISVASAEPRLSLVDREKKLDDGRVLSVAGWTVTAVAVSNLIMGGLLLWGSQRLGPTDDAVYGMEGAGIAFTVIGGVSLLGALPVAIAGEAQKSRYRALTVAPMATKNGGGAQVMMRF